MKWVIFTLLLSTSSLSWAKDSPSVETCSCVAENKRVERLWKDRRAGPVWIAIDPNYYVTCCRYRRQEAIKAVNDVWSRIRMSLADNMKRWDIIKKRGKNFSAVAQRIDCSREAFSLNHEMAMASLNIGAQFRCIPSICGINGALCGTFPRSDAAIENNEREEHERYDSALKDLSDWEGEVTQCLRDVYHECHLKHRSLRTLYEHGLLCQSEGAYQESAQLMVEHIQLSKELNRSCALSSEAYLSLSNSYQLIFQYDKAIEALTEAIQKYPDKKELYAQRVAAYFEQGRLDNAIQDFLYANLGEQLRSDPAKTLLAKAFITGASKGLLEGARQYPSTLLYSLRGGAQLLWAGVSDPIGVPVALMNDLAIAVEVLKSGEFVEILQKTAPELHELLTTWDSLPQETRWDKLGFAFGKYGFELLSSMGQRKALELFVRLRTTNTLCTVKTALSSPANKASTILTAEQIATRRTKYFSKAKIQWDKQGKHIEGHNSRKALTEIDLKTYSILTHKNPEELLKKHAGKGTPTPRGRTGEVWDVGYREDVNFGEIIGIWKSQDGKLSQATTRGRIHYDKDGRAHIVPTNPKSSP